MKYYIIAGEASGDLHGSNLIKALQKEDSAAQFQVWGGDLMEATGARLVKHYRDLAFMGFLEVVKNLRTILNNIKFCKKDILAYQPDALILIDYPGFNLRIAKWAKQQGIKVFYYISPQIWAWHSSRVHQIKKTVDRMFVILPFEKDFYKKYDYEVDFVGHPLLDMIKHRSVNPNFLEKNQLGKKEIIALLPGSRKQEISRILKGMLSVVPDFENYEFVIAGAPAIPESFYSELTKELPYPIKLIQNQTYDLLQHAKAALVTSGTATLETALFRVPQVVCYSGNPVSYVIAKRLINVKFISLVNLIIDRLIVKELIQHDFNKENIRKELAAILEPAQQELIQKDYQELITILGDAGASARTAKLMYGYLTKTN